MTATMILTNARILTMDPARPRASAIALAGDRILALGSRAPIEAMAGPGTEVIDCKGATLMPGFVESHLHLVLGGNVLDEVFAKYWPRIAAIHYKGAPTKLKNSRVVAVPRSSGGSANG